MTAQATKPTKPTKKRTKWDSQIIRKPVKGSKAEAILTLTTTTPATPIEIAESVDTSISNVSHTLKRYGITPNTVESFKNNRAEIFAGLQEKILKTINEDAIKDASVLQRITSAGILYDKERLERGQSTQNISALIGMIHEIRQDDTEDADIIHNDIA